MTKTRLLLLLARLCLSLNVWCQAPPQAAAAASQRAPGPFVEVEGSKLYYEESGTGPEAVVLIHDGIAHSAVWDDVWPTSVNGSTPSATTAAVTAALPLQPPGIPKPRISPRSFATVK